MYNTWLLRILRIAPLMVCFAVLGNVSFRVHAEDTNNADTEEAKAKQIIEEMGLTFLNQSVNDFTLDDTNGKSHKLSQYKGRWTFLVFWATWCGPCVYEMPTLGSLAKELKQAGKKINFLGIAEDNHLHPVKKFLDEHAIDFPILHDENGTVSSLYQAGSLPTLYLISPDWRVVGIFRGANDWNNEKVQKSLSELSHLKTDFSKFKETTNETLIELAPPELTLHLNVGPRELRVGDSIVAEARISWEGDSNKYLIKVPKLILPEEIMLQEGISSYTESSAENSTLIYQFKLRLEKEGHFKVGPLEMSFTSRFGKGKEQFVRAAEISLQVGKAWWWKFIYFLIPLSLISFICFFVMKKRKRSLLEIKRIRQKENEWMTWREEYENLCAGRVQNNERDFLVSLVKFAKRYWEKLGRETSDWDKVLENVQYAGKSINSQEIEFYQKKIERDLFPADE